jgi:hypothetical protein
MTTGPLSQKRRKLNNGKSLNTQTKYSALQGVTQRESEAVASKVNMRVYEELMEEYLGKAHLCVIIR